MEAFPIETPLVREVIERVRDKVDGYDVDASAFDADRRHPGRKDLPQLLDQLEEIVRPVDLVDEPGPGVADDEARPIDAPRPLVLVAHDPFGHMLGLEVRMVELLGFLEHVLAERAFVEAGRGDRAHVVEAARANGFRELDRVARSVDVGLLLGFGARGEIVNRREMEHMLDLVLELLELRVRHAKITLREIADYGDHPVFVDAPGLAQRCEFLLRSLADQNMDRIAALEQIFDQKAADETGAAGDEISHRDFLLVKGARRASIIRLGPGPTLLV